MTVLRPTVVLGKGCEHAAALAFPLAAAALQALSLAEVIVEIRANLLNLAVQWDALRRLAAEHGKESGVLAPLALRLLRQTIELGLLLCRCFLVAADLFGFRRIVCTAIHCGELAFQAQANGIARNRHALGHGRARGRGRGGRRIIGLSKGGWCKNGRKGQRKRPCAQNSRNDRPSHEKVPAPTAEASAGMVSKV